MKRSWFSIGLFLIFFSAVLFSWGTKANPVFGAVGTPTASPTSTPEPACGPNEINSNPNCTEKYSENKLEIKPLAPSGKIHLSGPEATIQTIINRAVANRPPVADSRILNTEVDVPLSVPLSAIDPDGDDMSFAIQIHPKHGSISISGTEATYTPDAGYEGQDAFAYAARDGYRSGGATVLITVGNPTNHPPVIQVPNQNIQFQVNVSCPTNISDNEGNLLTSNLLTPDTRGELSGDAENFTYNPMNKFGSDYFYVQAQESDGAEQVAIKMVQIKIAEPTAQTTIYDGDPNLGGVQIAPTQTGYGAVTFSGINTLNLSEGPHTIVVVSMDQAGSIVTASDVFEIDNTPPTIGWKPNSDSHPLDSVIKGGIGFILLPLDNLSVQHVELFIDDAVNRQDPPLTDPYAMPFNTEVLSDGPHTFTFIAVDGANLRSNPLAVQYVIDNTPPQTNISLNGVPATTANRTDVHGTVHVSVQATEADSEMSSLMILKDEQENPDPGCSAIGLSGHSAVLACDWETSNLIPGDHSITVEAVNSLGLMGSIEIPVKIFPNQAPTIVNAASVDFNPVGGKTAILSVLGDDDAEEENLRYTWSLNDSQLPTVTFDKTGTNAAKSVTATFAKAGAYPLRVTIQDAGGLSVTSDVTVEVSATLTTITIDPSNRLLQKNEIQQFTIIPRDQFVELMNIAPALNWSVTGGGSIDSTNGRFSAGATSGGPFLVTAKSGGVTGTASLTILNGIPTVATAITANPGTVEDTITELSVLGDDDSGESNLKYEWSAVGNSPASVDFSVDNSNAAKNTVATFKRAGTYSLQVKISDAEGAFVTTTLENFRVNQTPTSVLLTPSNANIQINTTQPFTATRRDQFNVAMSGVSTMEWSVDGGGLISPSGLFTAVGGAGGPYTVTATSLEGLVGIASVNILDGPPTTAPTVASAAAATPSRVITGTTTRLTVLGADIGGESNLTYTWELLGAPAGIVSFSSNGTNEAKAVTATFSRSGNYSFRVVIRNPSGASVTSSVNASAASTFTRLEVSPSNASLPKSGTQQFEAFRYDQFGTNLGTKKDTDWSVNGGGSIADDGYFSAGPTVGGPYTVTAEINEYYGTASLTISNGAPKVTKSASAIPNALDPLFFDFSVGGADDGGPANLTYTWKPLGPNPAEVLFSLNGTNSAKTTTAKFSKAGVYNFEAVIQDAEGLTVSSHLTLVVNQVLKTISLSPRDLLSNLQLFTAIGIDQFNEEMSIQPTFTWSVSGDGNISSSGLFTAGATSGTFEVKAAVGEKFATTSVTADVGPPQIGFVGDNPNLNDVVSNPYVFEVTALDPENHLAAVKILVDDNELHTFSGSPATPPFAWSLNTQGIKATPGDLHILKAIASDATGNTVQATRTIKVFNEVPTVQLVNAADLTFVRRYTPPQMSDDPVVILAKTTGQVDRVELTIDNGQGYRNVYPMIFDGGDRYRFNWNTSPISNPPVPEGEYVLSVTAYGLAPNFTASTPDLVRTICDFQNPTVTIESPTPTQALAGLYRNQNFQVKATDENLVDHIEFWFGTEKLATDSPTSETNSFTGEFLLDTEAGRTPDANGREYTFLAKVFDKAGNVETKILKFKVNNANPPVSTVLMTEHPLDGAYVSSNVEATISVEFSDDIDPNSFDDNTFVVRYVKDSKLVNMTGKVSRLGRTLTFSEQVPPNSDVTVDLLDVRDLNGKVLNKRFNFKRNLLKTSRGDVAFETPQGQIKISIPADALERDMYVVIEPLAEPIEGNDLARVLVKPFQIYGKNHPGNRVLAIPASLTFQSSSSDPEEQTRAIQIEFLDGNIWRPLGTSNAQALAASAGSVGARSVTVPITTLATYRIVSVAVAAAGIEGLFCYPNPFNPSEGDATIQYTLSGDSDVTIAIYDLFGNLVRTLNYAPGSNGGKAFNNPPWDGRNGEGKVIANGGYILQVVAKDSSGNQTKAKYKVGVIK